jgi:hypothetical protein
MCNGARVRTALVRAILLCALSAVQFGQVVGLAMAENECGGGATKMLVMIATVVITNLATIGIFRGYKWKTKNVGFAAVFQISLLKLYFPCTVRQGFENVAPLPLGHHGDHSAERTQCQYVG